MTRDELRAELARDPFQQFKLVLNDKRRLEVPYAHVVVFVVDGVLVFKGISSPESRVAKSFEFLTLDKIAGIERGRSGGRPRRRKAS